MGHPPRQHAAGIIGAHAGVVGVGGAVLQLGRVARQVEQQRRKTGEMDVFEGPVTERSEEHTSELQSLMRISYAVFCLKKTILLDASRHITYITKLDTVR